jgi:hypothetical protein
MLCPSTQGVALGFYVKALRAIDPGKNKVHGDKGVVILSEAKNLAASRP